MDLPIIFHGNLHNIVDKVADIHKEQEHKVKQDEI